MEERQLMNVVLGVSCWRRFTWARHPSSRPRLSYPRTLFFPPLFLLPTPLHWFNYTCNWPSFLRQDILPSPKQPTNISGCRPLHQGGIWKRTFNWRQAFLSEKRQPYKEKLLLCVFQEVGRRLEICEAQLWYSCVFMESQLEESMIFNIQIFPLL